MSELSTAVSALRANRMALAVVGNNIANANDPTYHRQDVRFVERSPVELDGIRIGQGVDIESVRRIYDTATEKALTRNISDRSEVEEQLRIAKRLELMFTPGQGTALDRLHNLFNEFERLTANPDDTASRSIVIQTAQAMASEINSLARQMDEIVDSLHREVAGNVEFINQTANEIAELNKQIRKAEIQGQNPNNLLDRRDRLVNELSEVVDAEIVTQNTEGFPKDVLVMADGQLQVVEPGLELVTVIGNDGSILVCRRGGDPLSMSHGKLSVLTSAQNNLIGTYQGRLQELVNGIVRGFDRIHATGVGTHGKFDQLVSNRNADELALPLKYADTIVPIEAGELYVGVTDPDGNRVLEAVEIDPETDSFTDVVAKLNGVDNLNAMLVDPPGQIALTSNTGYQFDFIMSQPSSVDDSVLNGSTQPTVAGIYDGQHNAQLTFEFSGPGEIGLTPGLKMTARDENGVLVGSYNVGQGYEPDSEIELVDGVRIQLSAGDVQASDEFSIDLIQEPDATGFLAAFGLNTLFTGTTAHGFAVNPDVVADHSRLATTRSGLPLDSRNAEAIVNLRHQQLLDDGLQTMEEYMGQTTALIGGEVQDISARQETLNSIAETLESERARISGVDPNEEAVKMLQFQRAFQGVAQYIRTIDEMLEILINVVN